MFSCPQVLFVDQLLVHVMSQKIVTEILVNVPLTPSKPTLSSAEPPLETVMLLKPVLETLLLVPQTLSFLLLSFAEHLEEFVTFKKLALETQPFAEVMPDKIQTLFVELQLEFAMLMKNVTEVMLLVLPMSLLEMELFVMTEITAL